MRLSLGFAGDFSIGGGATRDVRVSDICRDTAVFTDRVDLTFANFESCIVGNDGATDPYIAVPTSECRSLTDSGIDVFTLANNHTRDYGGDNLLLTRKVLNEQGIHTVGAGENIGKANAPLIVERDGKAIAFLGATDATHYGAGRKRPGVAPLNTRRLRDSIGRLRNEVDLVVVGIHSDLEFTNFPAPWKVRMSRQLAKAGADIVVHHHPHTLQGIEIYDNALIAYSLGSFAFPVHSMKYLENRDGHVDESVFLKVLVDFDGGTGKTITHELLPIVIRDDNKTQMATGRKGEQIVERMSAYSAYLDNQSMLRKKYRSRCNRLARDFIYGAYYSLRKGGARNMYEFLRFHFSTQVHRTWMRGFISFGWL